MIVKDLVLAKCINNEDNWSEKIYNKLEVDKYYVVEELSIGQSNSSVRINGKWYNSIMFEYYDDYLNLLDIYHSKYSPYFVGDKE